MTSILLESPSSETLKPVLALARQLGIRIRHIEDEGVTVPPDRAALERILDEGIHVDDPKSFLADFAQSRTDRPLPFRGE